MKITIQGTPKEIVALALAVQERQDTSFDPAKIGEAFANRLAYAATDDILQDGTRCKGYTI